MPNAEVDCVKLIQDRLESALFTALKVVIPMESLTVGKKYILGTTPLYADRKPTDIQWVLSLYEENNEVKAVVNGYLPSRDAPYATSIVKVLPPNVAYIEFIITSPQKPKMILNGKMAPRDETLKAMWLYGFDKKRSYQLKEDLREAVNAYDNDAPNITDSEIILLSYGGTKEIAYEVGNFQITTPEKTILVPFARPFGYWFAKGTPISEIHELMKNYPFYTRSYFLTEI